MTIAIHGNRSLWAIRVLDMKLRSFGSLEHKDHNILIDALIPQFTIQASPVDVTGPWIHPLLVRVSIANKSTIESPDTM